MFLAKSFDNSVLSNSISVNLGLCATRFFANMFSPEELIDSISSVGFSGEKQVLHIFFRNHSFCSGYSKSLVNLQLSFTHFCANIPALAGLIGGNSSGRCLTENHTRQLSFRDDSFGYTKKVK